MATYNLNDCRLDALLDRHVSPQTEYAILQALKQADLLPHGRGTIGVDMESAGGAYTIPGGDSLFLDVGSSNTMTLRSHGGVVISAGDGDNSILDKGPGHDTLVGGAGAQQLQVTRGDNVLIGGDGLNILIGGSGHDLLIGGGASLLEAGSGAATLFGGLNSEISKRGDPDDHSHHRDDRSGRGHDDEGHNKRGYGHDDRGRDHDDGSKGHVASMDTLIGGSGDDLMSVAHGDNMIFAGTGRATIYAGDGHDTISGSTLASATHAIDTICLGTGDTSIQGGAAGAATIYAGMHGDDTIMGSASGQKLSLYSQQSSHDVKSMTTSNGVTTITFKDHQSLSLEHVTIHFSNDHIIKV